MAMAATISEKNGEIQKLKEQLKEAERTSLQNSLLAIDYINRNSNLSFTMKILKERFPKDYEAIEDIVREERQRNRKNINH